MKDYLVNEYLLIANAQLSDPFAHWFPNRLSSYTHPSVIYCGEKATVQDLFPEQFWEVILFDAIKLV